VKTSVQILPWRRVSWWHGLLLAALLGTSGTVARAAPPLVQVNANLYKTEHCLFIIDSTVTWSSPTTAYNDLYAPGPGPISFPKLSGYFDTLTTQFPGNYFSVCYIANTGASNVPNYIDRTYKATGISTGPGSAGIGSGAAPGTFAAVDFCRYNLPGGNVVSPALAVFDHEIGHAWGAQIFDTLAPPILANGHWLSNSTVDCQLGGGTSAPPYLNIDKIYGDPVNGFRWQHVDNLRSNDFQVFSEQQLYLMGLNPTFPTSYVLNNPVFNADLTMGYSSVDTFDHQAAVTTYGVRNPDYTTAPRHFKLGFVYIARDLTEVNTVYAVVEQSINSFCNDEVLSATTFRSQTPFLCNTRYRASADGLLADLDGNATPALTVASAYITSTDGSASIAFTASDPDGTTPAVAVVPASSQCTISGSNAVISGLPDGVHFFTLRAADSGNKKAFAHFVVEVHRPTTSTIVTTQPVSQTAIAGNNATFSVVASGSPTPLTYQWYRELAKTSTWNVLANGSGYSGADTASLTVATTPAMDGDKFLCVVTNSTGTATSAPASLIVNETLPIITTQTSGQNVTAATSTYFRVTAGGSATFGYYYYQWQRLPAGSSMWTDVVASSTYNGPTNSQLTIYGTSLAMDGDQFRCVVSNTAGTTTSTPALLAVGVPPQITTQPLPVTSTTGQTISFTVAASGTAPLSYQWSKFGTVVGHAATLTLTNIQPADAGTYGVNVTNAFGLAYSNNVGLTVNAAPASSPTITTQPAAQSATVGSNVSFSVLASGSPAPTYQWRKDGIAISGATAATLSLTNVQASDAASYTVVATNASGSLVSASAPLTITLSAVAPTITTPPQSLTVTAGQSATFTVVATGTAPLSYQWSKAATTIAGATTATLSLPNAQAADAANYSVVVTNSAGSATSVAATLTVNPAPIPPTITTQPQSLTLTAGQNASLSVVAAGTAPLTYQWSKGAVAIAGATSATFPLTNLQASDAGNYAVVVTNAAGSITSAAATLTVNPAPLPPSITTQPQSLSTTVGQSVSFSVVASGAVPLTYVWRKNSVSISGATAATFALNNVRASDGADYTVVVSNAVGSITSSPATLLITAAAVGPSITTPPAATTVTAGQNVSFAVAVAGSAPFTYQWSKNGTAIAGATLATLTVTNAQATDAADYSVIVTNSVTSVTSVAATLTVLPSAILPAITMPPQSASITTGGTVAFSVTATGSAPFTYQWQKDGASIAGSSAATLVLANVQAGSAGDYLVLVSNVAGGVTSAAAHLTVLPAPSAPIITIQPSSVTVPAGASINFGVSASQATAYAWRFNGIAIPGATSATLNLASVQVADGGTYSVVVSNTTGSVTSNDATLSISAADFSGTYFGSFGNNGQDGEFGVVVQGNGKVSLMARFSGPSKAVIVSDISLQQDGSFAVGLPGSPLVRQTAGGTHFYTGEVTGQLGASSVTLTAPGLNLSGVAPRSAAGSAARERAGVYASLPIGQSTGEVYVLVGEAGECFLLELGATHIRSGTGGLGQDGGLHIVIDAGSATEATYAGTLNDHRFQGSVVTGNETVTLDPAPAAPGHQRLANLSSRGLAGAGDKTLIAGFVITGTDPKDVLIRAIGPALIPLGVAGTLANPKLKIVRGSAVVLENDDWGTSDSMLGATAARLGAFALPSGSKDSAILAHLAPGAYTAQVDIGAQLPGVAIIEVYDAGTMESTAPKVVNISTRAQVGRGGDILIVGFVIAGDSPKQVLLRAIGPTLAQYGVNGVLADPVIELFKGALLTKQNDDWGSGPDAALIAATAQVIGAAPLATASKDAALLLYLEPGIYTVHVRGVGDATGIALAEVYEVTD
jgi:hypothetical protein